MNRIVETLLALTLVSISAAGALADDIDDFIAEQAIVRLVPGADLAAFHAAHGTSTLAAIASRDIYLLQLPSGMDEDALEMTLEADPATIWAELNYEAENPEGRAAEFFVSGPPDSNSTYAEQYAHGRVALGPAHRISLGHGVVVGIVDTGIDASHPELVGRVLPNGWNFVDGDANTGPSGNGLDDDGDSLVDEMAAHGTHVAGIVAMVAPGARILPIKALEADGGGDAFRVAQAIFFGIDAGVDVLNLSLGSTYEADVVEDAIEEAAQKRIVIVAAGGNLDRAEPEEFPASESGVLGVISVGPDDVKSPFSNYGEKLEISAPGESILSTIPGGYATWSGTSMATAFVSGVAALLKSSDPRMDVESGLLSSAVDIDGSNPLYTELLGDGRLDAGRALLGPRTSGAP